MRSSLALFIISFFISVPIVYGQEIHDCSTHRNLKRLLNNKAFKAQYNVDQLELKQHELNTQNNKSGIVYTIPVVFHVIHNDGIENISDEQILSALDLLNRDFRRLNPDRNTVASSFQSLIADIEIEFKLATIAPDGTCFKGITRTRSPRTVDTENDNYDGYDQVDAIVNGNDVYRGFWDPTKYLNIYIAKTIRSAAGYTNYPTSFFDGDMYGNGIFMRHDYMGSIGTAGGVERRVLPHEVGHWLNLPHTWGSTNEPELASNCNTDDGIADTPNTIGTFACVLSESSCGPVANVENYMNYAECRKMFTTGQKSRMRAAVTSSIAGRNNLWKQNNLLEVGAISNLQLCKADFSLKKNIVCENTDVEFTDESLHNISSWSWSFPGGNPSTSIAQNPIVTYQNSGKYDVALTVSDGSSSRSITKENFVQVLSAEGHPAFDSQESFEDALFLSNEKWFVYEWGQSYNWELNSSVGASGTSSVMIRNGEEEGGFYQLTSNTINLGLDLPASISFKYAFAKKEDSNNDKLTFQVSKDCGKTWSIKKIISGTNLATAPNTFGYFVPSFNQWKTSTISVSSLSNFLVSNFRMRFIFEGGGGNNFYLDDINIGGPVGISENGNNNLLIYPNPVNDFLSIEGEGNSEFSAENLRVVDIVGKIVESSLLDNAVFKGNKVTLNTSKLSSGIYFVVINKKYYQFIKQ